MKPYVSHLAGILLAVLPIVSRAQEPAVSVIADGPFGRASKHGLGAVKAALKAKGVAADEPGSAAAMGKSLLVIGLARGEGLAARLLKDDQCNCPDVPEALVVHKTRHRDRPAWVIAGSDDRGLMYALLDVADRIGWSTEPSDPFQDVRETVEKPDVSERALSMYTMNRAYWESRFHDEAYWPRYFDLLARCRFNSVVIICGYENGGFLAPAYPYVFDVEGFPDVRMVGLTADEQRRNLVALNRLIAQAHERGLRVTLGLWDHIYRGGVQGGGVPGADEAVRTPTPGLVWGVTADNLVPYTRAALAKLVRVVPDLDAIQFRMHDESGLKPGEQEGFWRDVFAMMKQAAPNLRLDLRAKGLPDSVIDAGLESGVPLRITTKYWMEQMGLPFHPTHINVQDQQNRRHGYADMLRYPQRYRMHWRLWNGGTARVLLWGDPEYARRFAASTHLYDGDGFEVNEPLATKMEAQPHDAKPFDLLRPSYRYYDYEFERYWHFFQAFGRVGYDPGTPADVWHREFTRRFGPDAAPFVESALHRASWVLPRIVASCYPYGAFPTTRGWAEKQRLGDLPAYAKAEGSDIQLFASFDEEARNLIAGTETAKVRPRETSRWFEETAAAIAADLAGAEARIGDHRGKEYESTVVDLEILANLARFHARRIPAAVNERIYERTKDLGALGEAIEQEGAAIAAWRDLVAAAGDVYADDLMMGVRSAGLCGHWRDELAALEKGHEKLKHLWSVSSPLHQPDPSLRYRPVPDTGDVEPPTVVHRSVTTAPAGQPLTISAEVRDPSGVKWVRLRYRPVNQREDYATLPMSPTGTDDRYEAVVPAGQINPAFDFMYFLEVMDNRGNGAIRPDFRKETPYVVVRLAR
jgi:hypothetical protein